MSQRNGCGSGGVGNDGEGEDWLDACMSDAFMLSTAGV